MAAVTDGRGTIRMIVDKRATAKRVFAHHLWETTEEEVLLVALPDSPGSLGKIAHKLREASVNIDYEYAGLGPTARRINAYLGVAAKRPGFDVFDFEADLLLEQLAGRTRCDQLELGQPVAIEGGEGNQVGLLAVVGDDRESRDA